MRCVYAEHNTTRDDAAQHNSKITRIKYSKFFWNNIYQINKSLLHHMYHDLNQPYTRLKSTIHTQLNVRLAKLEEKYPLLLLLCFSLPSSLRTYKACLST